MNYTNDKVGIRTGKWGPEAYALAKISQGEFIAAFDGPIHTAESPLWSASHRTYHYNHAVRLGRGRWRIASSVAHLLDHSCDPNCEMRMDGDEAPLYAKRDIKYGEALTWDYGQTEKGGMWKLKCQCGSPKCRGTIP